MTKGKQHLIMTTIRAPREFWSKVRTQAFEENISVGELVLKALAAYLKREGGK
jgi:hypothetical protein